MTGRYLINCSGSKLVNFSGGKSNISNLSYNDSLFDQRQNIITNSGINLSWNNTLPAWQLYKGKYSKLYNQVESNNWIKPSTNILILSALFGWIKHTDLIPAYDLSMKDKISGIPVYQIWFQYGILNSLIDSKNDIDLLTQNYRRAIHSKPTPVATTPYKPFKDNYGTHKGKWLNNRL